MLQYHTPSYSICFLLLTDKVVVGLSSDAVFQRNPAVSPSNQLAQATEFLDVGVKSSEICFSFDVCNNTSLLSLTLMPVSVSVQGGFVMTFARKSLVVCNIAKRRQRR